MLMGDNGLINRAKNAGEETREKSAIEKVQLMLADYMAEKYTGTKTLEDYLNKQKTDGKLDKVTNNGNGTITVEVDGYEITIKEDDLSIIGTEKAGGEKTIFQVYLTKTNGSTIEPSEKETLEQKAITIDIINIGEFGEIYTIEVKDSKGNILTKETNIISNVTGQASYIIKKSGIYTITVTGTKEGKTRTSTKTEEIKLAMPIIEDSSMFSKANGVIDIVWLDTDNNVINEPVSPANYLGGLTAIKYDGTNWVEADETNADNSWYNYVAQIGTSDGKTSNWANARSSDSNVYFVWIPRYAYKITYFNTPNQVKAYRESGNTEGIIGYSNIEGMVKVENGVEKLLKDSKPTNVIGKAKTSQYTDYIVHPAFRFGEGTKTRNMGRQI